jgi:hypothetical protein
MPGGSLAVAAALTLPEEKRASPSFVHERKNYDGCDDENKDDYPSHCLLLLKCSEEASSLHLTTIEVVALFKRGVAPKGNTTSLPGGQPVQSLAVQSLAVQLLAVQLLAGGAATTLERPSSLPLLSRATAQNLGPLLLTAIAVSKSAQS